MCLSEATQVFNPPLPEEREVWKVFTRTSRKYEMFGVIMFSRFPANQWIQCEGNMDVPVERYGEGWKKYLVGFHSFTTEDNARRYAEHLFTPSDIYAVLPCKVRGITALGFQIGSGGEKLASVVSREIFVDMAERIG